MQQRTITSLLSAVLMMTAVPSLADEKPVTEQLVDTLTTLSGGPHAGFRANHAKGVMLEGAFTPSAQAANISKAAHFQKGESPILVRFSNATGVPNIPDANGNAFPKGIAIRFQLEDEATDIVSISVNSFPTATPEEFLGLLNAVRDSQNNAAKPSPVEQFLASHPAAAKFVTTPKPAPASFATQPFFGVNAFKFTNAGGQIVYGRYQIIPVTGAKFLSKEDADKAAPDYLMDEIVERVKTQTVQYRLVLQIADQGDEVNNATVVWPEGRRTVELGTLTLKSAVADSRAREKTLMFNPLQLPEGIEPSEDPILLARPGAYAVSFGRRLAH